MLDIWWIIWLLCAIGAGFIYQSKNRPFGRGFLWGLLLGIIGVIVTLCKSKLEEEESLIKLSQQNQNSAFNSSITDELEKLSNLKNNNTISEEEFLKLKDKLLNSSLELKSSSSQNKQEPKLYLPHDRDDSYSNGCVIAFFVIVAIIAIGVLAVYIFG